jgi:hypothetical protein
MASERENPHVGEQVIFLALPPGLLDGLPEEDQRAIRAKVGQPVTLVGYDEDGRAELSFDDPFDGRTPPYSHTHSIWVAPAFIARVQVRPTNQSGPGSCDSACTGLANTRRKR